MRVLLASTILPLILASFKFRNSVTLICTVTISVYGASNRTVFDYSILIPSCFFVVDPYIHTVILLNGLLVISISYINIM